MTQVYKCERCGKYFDSDPIRLQGGALLGTLLRINWYPDSVDLCRDCGDQLKELIGQWWPGEREW